jgi:hypothetical protein
MTQLFRKFDVDNFDNIQSKLIPWVQRHHRWTLKFWNHVDQDQLFADIPELLHTVESIVGQTPLKTYMLAIPWAPEFILRRKIGAHSLHRDTSVESTRFNWPVLNGTSIETKLFTCSKEPDKKTLVSGETYLKYHEKDCKEVASFLLDRPTLLHVHTIHGLYRATGPLPRYILSFNFEQSIEHLLH